MCASSSMDSHCVCVRACVCSTDCVQPAVATLQLPDPSQDVHRRVDPRRLGSSSSYGSQLVWEGGESRPEASFLPSGDIRTLSVFACVRCTGVGHVRRVLRQPPRPPSHPDRLRLRGSPLQEGLPSLRIRRGEFCQSVFVQICLSLMSCMFLDHAGTFRFFHGYHHSFVVF